MKKVRGGGIRSLKIAESNVGTFSCRSNAARRWLSQFHSKISFKKPCFVCRVS